jgi:hypothetical protein
VFIVTRKARIENKSQAVIDSEDLLDSLKPRTKRTILRKIESGEVIFSPKLKQFVYKDTDEEFIDEEKSED